MSAHHDCGSRSARPKKSSGKPDPTPMEVELERIQWDTDTACLGNGLIVVRQKSRSQWPKDEDVKRAMAAIVGGWLASKNVTCGLEGSLALDLDEEGSLLEYRWPRKLAWTDLPLARDAQFKLHKVMPEILDAKGDGPHWPSGRRKYHWQGLPPDQHAALGASLRDCQAVLVDLAAEPGEQALSSIAEALVTYGRPGAPLPSVGWFDRTQVHDISHKRLHDARHAVRAHHRFAWSHTVNACVIMSRAFAEARSGLDPDDQLLAGDGFKLFESNGRTAGTPWGLQVLHAVHSLAPPVTEEDRTALVASGKWLWKRSDDIKDRWSTLYHGTPFFEFAEEGNAGRVVWKGSGRYPGISGAPVGNLADCPGPHPIQMALIILDMLGLVKFDPHGNTRTTPLGARFLELVGTATRDPDVVLRWRTPQGLLGTEADIPAMDRWLHRTFRAVKRRVQHLEDGGPFRRRLLPWEEDGSYTEDMPSDPLTPGM